MQRSNLTEQQSEQQSAREDALARLEADGLIRRGSTGAGRCRTTRRWQAAMARAAWTLWRSGDAGADLRTPVALALLEVYGPGLDDFVLADLVETMLPIEAGELDPRAHLGP